MLNRHRLGTEQRRFAYIVILPILGWFIIFAWYPIFRALFLGFFDWYGFLDPKAQFAGFQNYQKAFQDEVFLKSLYNTFIFTIEVVGFGIPISLGLAYILNSINPKISSLARTVFFIPVVTSIIAAALIFRLIFEPTFGMLNKILGYFNIPPQLWLKSVKQALQCVIGMTIWKWVGFYMIIFLAALQGIDQQYYDAAKVDGATPWQTFWGVTFPLLQPTFLFVLVIWVISSLRVFTEPYMLTSGGGGHGAEGGGPAYATTTVIMYIIRQAFDFQKLGYGAAMSIIVFCIILVLSYLQMRFLRSSWEE